MPLSMRSCFSHCYAMRRQPHGAVYRQVTVALALLVMALCFALVTALTVVLKVGNDG